MRPSIDSLSIKHLSLTSSYGEAMKKSSNSKTSIRYRDAGNGKFLKESQAKRRSKNTVIRERVPKPGYGDTKT